MISLGEYQKKSMEAELALSVMVFFFLQTAVLIPFLILINDVNAGKVPSRNGTSITQEQAGNPTPETTAPKTCRVRIRNTRIEWDGAPVTFEQFEKLSGKLRPEDRILIESDQSLLARAVQSLGRRGINRIELAYRE